MGRRGGPREPAAGRPLIGSVRRLVLACVLVLLTACATARPSVTGTGMSSPRPLPQRTAVAVPSAAASDTLPTPGRPYGADEVLAAMRNSRHPGGVPDSIETLDVTEQVAAELWTFDGEPWQTLSASGSCGAETCSLDVAGTPASGGGEDLYQFIVDPGAGSVELVASDLHGYPILLEAPLDAIVRAGVDGDLISGLQLVSVRWLPPPDAGQFVLSYRSGGEEGAPSVDVVVDFPGRRVVEVRDPTRS